MLAAANYLYIGYIAGLLLIGLLLFTRMFKENMIRFQILN